MSLAKLTSLSTQTLSLLLERQRLQTLSSTSTHNAKLGQITRNLNQLRNGILELEKNEGGRTEAVRLLRSQYERMRGMLGEDAAGVESLQDDPSPFPSPAPAAPRSPSPRNDSVKVTQFAPYTDDPEGPPNRYQDEEPQVILQTQRRLIDDQDAQLDVLSSSINRQHHLSLQINSELDSHVGLLEELDTDLDRTEGRLNGARRSLDRVAKGAKENSSTVIIAILILVLLLLIIVFKT